MHTLPENFEADLIEWAKKFDNHVYPFTLVKRAYFIPKFNPECIYFEDEYKQFTKEFDGQCVPVLVITHQPSFGISTNGLVVGEPLLRYREITKNSKEILCLEMSESSPYWMQLAKPIDILKHRLTKHLENHG